MLGAIIMYYYCTVEMGLKIFLCQMKSKTLFEAEEEMMSVRKKEL
jgi:hypothetical protein